VQNFQIRLTFDIQVRTALNGQNVLSKKSIATLNFSKLCSNSLLAISTKCLVSTPQVANQFPYPSLVESRCVWSGKGWWTCSSYMIASNSPLNMKKTIRFHFQTSLLNPLLTTLSPHLSTGRRQASIPYGIIHTLQVQNQPHPNIHWSMLPSLLPANFVASPWGGSQKN